MTKRGKVLREPASGPGLLIMEGQQYRFAREGVWKSVIPPKPGLVVDVELNAQGQVRALTAVPESQLASEHAAAAGVLDRRTDRNHPSRLTSRLGLPFASALGLLVTAWFFLTAVAIQVPFPEKLDFTFWQILGLLNSPGHVPEFLGGRDIPNAGPWGFAALIALAGPFFHQFWNDRRAFLGGALPLVFIIAAGIAVRVSLLSAIRRGIVETGAGTSSAISIGPGIYLSIAAALYLAFAATRDFASARMGARHEMEPPRRKAA